MYQRPKLGESEEDLLKLQEEFFKNKTGNEFKPAAKVVKGNNPEPSTSTQQVVTEQIQERLNNTFEDIPRNAKIGSIVEKAPDPRKISKFKFSRTSGFPLAKRRYQNMTSGPGSVFAQQMKRLKTTEPDNVDVDVAPFNPTNLIIKERTPGQPVVLPDKSFIVMGDEKDNIHKENVDVMSKMTEEEILEEREKLMSTMDPAIVAFLKSRRYHNTPPVETRQPSIAEQNKTDDFKLEDIETTSDILREPDADKWLNFDKLETNKLAWMKGVNVPKIDKDKQYEARFDFGGWLLPFSENDINEKNRVLYHHGEEPGRPGYTLQELFQLCRSSVIQQKIIALNTIANILQLQSSGIYDNVIDIPIEQIFFVVRFCLDENTPATLNASIKALRNLFYYPIDETCLDGLLGFGLGMVQPILAIDNNESEDDKTVNDQHLAETNLVKCLARTDIIIRIRYIISTVKPSIETIVYCLEILIRLIRDSDFTAEQIYRCDGLLDCIISNFVPRVYKSCPIFSAYGLPLTHAIKFLRILCTRNKTIATNLVEKYKILDSVAMYLSNEFVSANTNGLKLQIESLHLWQTTLHYGIGLQEFKGLQPILVMFLNYHLMNTDALTSTSYTIQAYVSAFLNVISQVIKHDYECALIYIKMIIDNGVPKWFTQFSGLKEFSCGKLQLISSLLNLLFHVAKYLPINVYFPLEKINQAVQSVIESSGFTTVTKTLRNGSNVLNNYEAHKCSTNFKYTDAAVWSTADHVIPVVQSTSSLPFMNVLTNFIVTSNSSELKLAFLQHENIKDYISAFQNSSKFYLTSNWYTKIESSFIMNMLKMAVSVQSNIDTGTFYDIAVKVLCIFNTEQKADIEYLLKNVVFSPRFYPSEVFMRNLNLNDEDDALKSCLANIDDVFEVYIQVLQLRNNVPSYSTSLCTDLNLGNVMPIDWIYSPIIVLYSNQQQKKSSIAEQEQVFIVTNCLRWVYIYESYFPKLAMLISPTDRFCRLACTFLGSDTLFLLPEVRSLLELCLKHIMSRNEPAINFDKTIQGLNNFQDFYTQLLEQYQGVSYGDKLFANFVLIPLAQRHNVKLRKTLWSEYAGIVQIFNLTENEIFSPLELFLKPVETDVSLLKCYRRALMSGMVRKTSVLHTVAHHHVNAFIEIQKRKSSQ